MFHHLAEDLQSHTSLQIGLIYGDFQWKNRSTDFIHNNDITYNYLGLKQCCPPKRGILWKYWLWKYEILFKQYTVQYGRPDLIHGHSILGLLAASHLGKVHNIPYIYTEHLGGFMENRISKQYLKKAKQGVLGSKYNSGVSPLFAHRLSSILEQPFHYIPNYIDHEVFYPMDFQHSHPVFISIGRPAEIKGLDNLITAFHRVLKVLPKARLYLVDDLSDFQAQLDIPSELGRAIVFTGEVSREKVRDLLHQSSVLVSASKFESFGMTMAEAMSCGRPVVATDTAGSRLILEEGGGQIVPQDDIPSLAEAMIFVYKNLDQYSPSQLHDSIHRRFGVEQICRQWESIYHSLRS